MLLNLPDDFLVAFCEKWINDVVRLGVLFVTLQTNKTFSIYFMKHVWCRLNMSIHVRAEKKVNCGKYNKLSTFIRKTNLRITELTTECMCLGYFQRTLNLNYVHTVRMTAWPENKISRAFSAVTRPLVLLLNKCEKLTSLTINGLFQPPDTPFYTESIFAELKVELFANFELP